MNGRDEPFVQAYHEHQVATAILYGADPETAVADMQAVLNFEFELASISMSREERRDSELLYNPMTVVELQVAYQYVNWLEYFNSFLPIEAQLMDDDTIIVAAISFFQQLGDLLSRTDNRVIANYLMWRLAFDSATYLGSEIRALQLEFNKKVTGISSEQSRWYTCVDSALKELPHAFGAMYVRRHFDEASKADALEMVHNIKDEFKIILDEV